MRSRRWASPPPPQHVNSSWHDTYGGVGPDPAHDPGPGKQPSRTSPSASACGVSTMTCPRCDGLVVREYLLDPREGSLSGFHASRCLNCGAIHDNVIRMNQRVPPSPGRFRSPPRRVGPRLPKRRIHGARASLGWIGKRTPLLRTRILVVDDDPDLRSVLQERLTHRGYRVETAERSEERRVGKECRL